MAIPIAMIVIGKYDVNGFKGRVGFFVQSWGMGGTYVEV